jgi:PAS domain S-box-containing protein
VTDGEGDIIAYVGQTIDVTDKRRAEAALRDSEVRFHQLMANLGVGIWLFDTASERMDYVSPGYERMFGISLADLQADPWCWLARVDPDDRERVRSIISETPNDVDVEYRFRRPDGSMGVALGRSFPVLGTDGASGRTAGIVADITASRETEDQLRELGTALDQTSDGVLMLDADGVVLYANAAYERITGFGPTEVLGHVRHALPEAMVDGDMRERIRRGEMWKGRVKSPRSDGSEYLAEVTVWPIADGDERAARHIAIVRDITVEAGLSEALAEESRAREALAASIVHLSGATRAEDTAEAICDELMALPGADIASVLVFDRDGTATPLAFRGPPGSPLRVGQPLPESRSHYLFERAALRTWVEDWRPSAEDGGYGARWTDLGLDSVAYLPIRIRGDLGGLMVVGSMQPGGALVLSSKLPGLQELAVVSGALLAEQLSERLRNGALRARIQRVIAEDGFSPVFQPVVDLASSTVVGFEALTRFADGTAPDRVFADAEAAGLGLELEEATIAAALAASEDLQPGAWLALNVSPALASSAERLRRAVGRSERPIVLEITEQSPVEDYDAVHEAVRSLGPDVRLAVDDAGAGFASLRHIIELRPQFVKLDMALVRGIDRDPARQALVAGMVYYAGATGCALIAEGVEAEGERRTLRRLGVSFGQGYLLGKPGPAVPAPPRRMRRSRDVAQERVPQAV